MASDRKVPSWVQPEWTLEAWQKALTRWGQEKRRPESMAAAWEAWEAWSSGVGRAEERATRRAATRAADCGGLVRLHGRVVRMQAATYLHRDGYTEYGVRIGETEMSLYKVVDMCGVVIRGEDDSSRRGWGDIQSLLSQRSGGGETDSGLRNWHSLFMPSLPGAPLPQRRSCLRSGGGNARTYEVGRYPYRLGACWCCLSGCLRPGEGGGGRTVLCPVARAGDWACLGSRACRGRRRAGGPRRGGRPGGGSAGAWWRVRLLVCCSGWSWPSGFMQDVRVTPLTLTHTGPNWGRRRTDDGSLGGIRMEDGGWRMSIRMRMRMRMRMRQQRHGCLGTQALQQARRGSPSGFQECAQPRSPVSVSSAPRLATE